MSPLHAIAFALGLLVGACSTLPAAAYPAPVDELAAVHSAWVAGGFPACATYELYVLEASAAERLQRCRQPVPSCLASTRTGMMTRVPLAVVSPEYPDGWRHEFWHSLEACAGWPYDHAHTGPQWSDAARARAGIP